MVARRIGLARARKAAAYTQEGLAAELDVDAATVSNWERGKTEPLPYKRPKLASLLGVTGERLEQLLQEGLADNERAGVALPRTRVSGTQQDALLASSDAVLAEPSSEGMRPSKSRFGLAAGPAEHVDELVMHLRDQWHALVRTDNVLGPRFALAGVLDHIAIIEELLPVTSGSRRGELVTLAATYAESAAWLHEDAGQLPAATYWVGRAMEWAHEAGDGLLLAWTLFRRSQHAAADGDPQRTISLARAAGRDGDRLPNPMRAAIVQQEAQGHALAGEEITSHRALDTAHQWAARDTAGDARGGHGSFCGETYLELQRAQCWSALGKPQLAVEVYEEALPMLPPVYRRDRGVACGRLAHAYVDVGEPEAAAQVGLEALAIARSSGSVRTEQDVVLVGRRLRGHRHLYTVEQLLQELSPAGAR